MGDYLPKAPLNHHEKFDTASFIFAGEINNRTKLQTNKQTNNQTSSKRYIHTLPIGMYG